MENEEKTPQRPKNIAERVRELLFDAVLAEGCYLWDVEYVKEGADRVLRLLIDSNEGVTLDDCERVSRAVDPLLDEADPIETSYRLEVVSPGVERPLVRPEHFEACLGEEIEVRLYAPPEGLSSKTLRGTLTAYGDGILTVTAADGTAYTFPRGAWAKVSTVYDW